MLQLLTGFAALSLVSGALTALLPEGSVRHAASMAIGLIMLLYWVQGLDRLIANLPVSLPSSVCILTNTGVSVSTAQSHLTQEALP